MCWVWCYIAFSRFVLNGDQKRLFEKLSMYCDRYAELIPVSFVLGELGVTGSLIINIQSLNCLFIHNSPYLQTYPQ